MAHRLGERLTAPVRLTRPKYTSCISALSLHAWRSSNDLSWLQSRSHVPSARHNVASSWQYGSRDASCAREARRDTTWPVVLASRQPDYGLGQGCSPGASQSDGDLWARPLSITGPSTDHLRAVAGGVPSTTAAPVPRQFQQGTTRVAHNRSLRSTARAGLDFSRAASGGPWTATDHARGTPGSLGHGSNRHALSTFGSADGSRISPGRGAGHHRNNSDSAGASTPSSGSGPGAVTRIRSTPAWRGGDRKGKLADEQHGTTAASPTPGGAGAGKGSREITYSQRIARLRKPALTAADKLGVDPEERARIFRLLRTPRRWVTFPGVRPASHLARMTPERGLGSGNKTSQVVEPRALLPVPLHVFCYGIDDVRLYRALEGADAIGLVVVVPDVAASDAVWATRTKRTGKLLTLTEISNAAQNAKKPFVELSAISPVRVMEAMEALTGWPVPEHLLRRAPPPLLFLPPLEADPSGSAEALRLLTGGRSLAEYLIARAGPDISPPILREMDCTDLYESREDLLPVNPQEREAARQQPVFRPYMEGSRQTRQRLRKEQLRRKADTEGEVPW